MLNSVVWIILWVGAIGCGVMAGVYFTFSTFVMTSLARIEPPAGIAAMQSINEVIVRSIFLPLFFITTLLSAAAVVLGLTMPDRPGAQWMLIAGAAYVVGMFVCTVVFNVPLNNRLAAVDPSSAAGAQVWELYLRVWTRWNHVRTVSCTLASVLFVLAIWAQKAPS